MADTLFSFTVMGPSSALRPMSILWKRSSLMSFSKLAVYTGKCAISVDAWRVTHTHRWQRMALFAINIGQTAAAQGRTLDRQKEMEA